MTEHYLVFRDRETGRELLAYTIRGTFDGEDYRALIAVYEHVLDNARALLRP